MELPYTFLTTTKELQEKYPGRTIIYTDSSQMRGCRSEAVCQRCGIKVSMGGKPGTKSEDGNTVYVGGPCVCGTRYCPECWDRMKEEKHPETLPPIYVDMKTGKEVER